MSGPGAQGAEGGRAGERLAAGLERVLAALAQGDAEAARAAAQEAEAACADLATRGERLAPETRAALADACARAEGLAAGFLERLGGALSGAARSRRAADAYGAGPTSPHRNLP